jgi:hypothetical protein
MVGFGVGAAEVVSVSDTVVAQLGPVAVQVQVDG